MEINYAIRWIAIYPVDSAIRRLNNRGQTYKVEERTFGTPCISYLKNCSDTQSFSHVLLCSFMFGPQSHSPVVDEY